MRRFKNLSLLLFSLPRSRRRVVKKEKIRRGETLPHLA